MKQYLTYLLLLTTYLFFGQEKINFNKSWKFALNINEEASFEGFNDAQWRVLNLPHDWSIEGEFDKNNPSGMFGGYLPGGIGWYRKTIEVPQNWKDKNIEITFDGVFRNSTVWVNDVKLGHRPYGWVSFSYDISEIANKAKNITFVVKVDCEQQPAARWYTGAGIYANTYIDVKDKMHIDRNSVFVRTKGNDVLVDVDLLNQTSKKEKISLINSVLDASGKVVAFEKTKLTLMASTSEQKTLLAKQLIPLKSPKLWSPKEPNLYTLLTEIKLGNKTVDKIKTIFGVREVKWVPATGMWLNGVNTKLQGVCNHQAAGALGAAVPEKILRFRIQQLKDMGVNAIRTAHNAQTPTFYKLCDEMGMMVMDEFFDGWHKKAEHDYGAHSFEEWWERDLTDLIKRDRNHPSIVIYSVGNESKGDYGKRIVALSHKIDDTRLVTSGHAGPDDMDVYGENGGSEGKSFFETLGKDRAFIGTENVHTWHTRGFYRTQMWYRDGYPGKRGDAHYYPNLTDKEVFTYDWTNGTNRSHAQQTLRSSYDNSVIGLTVRQNIEKLRDIPNFSGSFRWTGYDYLGEVKYHGGWPFKSFSGGAMDMANFKKDLFYLYQSQWTTEPMVHLFPHWTHPTLKIGTEIPVWVYSNCEEVELFFNGKSLGKQKPGTQHDKMQCQWLVPWSPGELKAIAYKNGKALKEQVIRTASAPSKIQLSVDGESLLNEENDIAQVRVTATDDKGEMYPYGENRTYFKVHGTGKIRALDNGSPLDTEKYYEAESRIGFFGLTKAYVESTKSTGEIQLFAGCILGEKKLISSSKVSINTQFINLRGVLKEPTVKVYYTLDGSTPNENSKLYSSSFDVEIGTTVKALVILNGKKAFVMEERFADDEGFAWEPAVYSIELGGDQAEDAKYNGALVAKTGAHFKGTGYVEFGEDSNNKGFVEWYYENDRSDGKFTLKLRYSASDKFMKEQKIIISVNDKQKEVVLIPTKKYKSEWKIYETKMNFNAGANYIKVLAKDVNGLSIDEIVIE